MDGFSFFKRVSRVSKCPIAYLGLKWEVRRGKTLVRSTWGVEGAAFLFQKCCISLQIVASPIRQLLAVQRSWGSDATSKRKNDRPCGMVCPLLPRPDYYSTIVRMDTNDQ